MGLKDASVVQVPSRIVVADDHPLFRSAIRHTLEAHPDLEVVAEAANGQEAVELCRRLRPELVLMDLRMPVMDGVAATQAIKREFPDTFVLILTAVDESAGLSDSLEAGAAGYVLKDAPAARITDAVRRVLAGESPLDEKVAMRTAHEPDEQSYPGGGGPEGKICGLLHARKTHRVREEDRVLTIPSRPERSRSSG